MGIATSGLGLAAGVDPEPISKGLLTAVAAITGIFSAHHTKAVQTEAQALNAAVPATEQSFQAIFGAVNSGQITGSEADSAIDTTLANYDATVFKQFGVKDKSGNGPHTVEDDWLKPWAAKLKALIAGNAPGTVTFDAIPAHAGFAGTPGFSVAYTPPASSSTTSLTSAAAGATSATPATSTSTSLWLWVAIAAVILVVLMVKK